MANSGVWEDKMQELREICAQLEGDDVPLDLLSRRLERGYQLVAELKDTLFATQVTIENIIRKSRDERPAGGGSE